MTGRRVAVVAVVLLLHFQVAEIQGYPLTVGLLLSGVVVAVSVRGAPPMVPFALLALVIAALCLQTLLDPGTDQVQFLRSLALFAYSVGLVLWVSSAPVSPRGPGARPYLVAIVLIDGLAWLQYLAGSRGIGFFFNPWRGFTYLYLYNPRLGLVPVRAEAFYLEPSFAALVLVICATAAILAGTRPLLAVSLCGIGMLAVRSASGILTVGVLAVLSIVIPQVSAAGGRRGTRAERVFLLAVLGGLAIAFTPYAVTRLTSTDQVGSSSNYRLAAPVALLRDLLGRTVIGEPLGSVNRAVSDAGLLLGTQVGSSLDNGLYVYVYYFGWVGIVAALTGLVVVALRGLAEPRFGRVAALAVPILTMSALFTGAVFTPEYAVLVALVIGEARRRLATRADAVRTATDGIAEPGQVPARNAGTGARSRRAGGRPDAVGVGPAAGSAIATRAEMLPVPDAPLLSVITVVRDDLSGLQRTHRSLHGLLTRAEVEWVVADGVSTDGTAELLAAVSQPGMRWVSERDSGIYDAMNRATGRARGRFLWYLNAGDEAAVEVPRALVDLLGGEGRRPGPDRVLYGDYVLLLANGSEVARGARPVSYLRHSLPTSHQAMLFPRAAVDAVGRYNTGFSVTGDYDLVARLLRAGVGLHRVPIRMARFGLGGQSTRMRAALIREAAQVQRSVLGQPWIAVTGSRIRRRLSFAALTALEHRRRPGDPRPGGPGSRPVPPAPLPPT